MKSKILYLCNAGMIAALYVVLTLIANSLGLANGAVQVRFSEALTILPIFTASAIPGLVVGCLISNILTGCILPDIIFGSIATLLGALGTRALRKIKPRILAAFPPVISNMLIIPFILTYAYHIPGSLFFNMATVGLGELISCVVLGGILLTPLTPLKDKVFEDR